MKRRDFLKGSTVAATQLMVGQTLLNSLLASQVQAATGLRLKDLFNRVSPEDGTFLIPKDTKFAEKLISFNQRTQLTPQLRALCRTPVAVANTLAWARENKVPLAIRGGGHSYEGFSQSLSVVIDTRLMNSLEIDSSGESASFGAGVALGQVYAGLSEKGRVIPAGSCPTVGVAGHTTGGGFGLLARPFGLACDSLQSVRIVTADGRILTANANENSDLFWACRGGGNGQFGVITQLDFKTHEIDNVTVFAASWVLPPSRALKIAQAWQEWAPNAPSSTTTILKFSKHESGQIALRFIGQSLDSEDQVRYQINAILNLDKLDKNLKMETMPFMAAVKHFAGGFQYESVLMKAKSDYLFQPMSAEGFLTLMRELQKLPASAISAICDSYGGAVNAVSPEATAFAHRKNTRFSIQYYSQWAHAKDTADRLQRMRGLYQAMRPHVSGRAYVNYCDLDLKDYPTAYWGDNLARLQQVKAAYDPQNFFQHAQSIPLKSS